MNVSKTWEFAGRRRTFRELHILTGFPIHALYTRLVDRGMTVTEALTEPFPAPLRGQSGTGAQPTKRLVPYAGK